MGKAIIVCGFAGDNTKTVAPGVSNAPVMQAGLSSSQHYGTRLRLLSWHIGFGKFSTGPVGEDEPPIKVRLVRLPDGNGSYRSGDFKSWLDDSISETFVALGVQPASNTWDHTPDAVLASRYINAYHTPHFEVEYPRNTGPVVAPTGAGALDCFGWDISVDAAATDTVARIRVGYSMELF